MKKIYPIKMLAALIFLLRSINAMAKKHMAEANLSVTGKPVNTLVQSLAANGKAGLRFTPFIQFSHLEFRSLN